MLLELLVTLCEQHGVATLTASSGEAALTLLRQHGPRIDWLLTDIRLPVSSTAGAWPRPTGRSSRTGR